MKRTASILLSLLIASMMDAEASVSVTLEWSPSPDTNVVGYYVYWSQVSGGYGASNRVQVAAPATNATVSGLSAGVDYHFVATARDASGLESVPSNEVDMTPTAPVATLSAGPTPGLQSLSWTSNTSQGVTNYAVWWQSPSMPASVWLLNAGRSSSAVVSNSGFGTRYRVAAQNPWFASPMSNTATNTCPNAPVTLQILAQ